MEFLIASPLVEVAVVRMADLAQPDQVDDPSAAEFRRRRRYLLREHPKNACASSPAPLTVPDTLKFGENYKKNSI